MILRLISLAASASILGCATTKLPTIDADAEIRAATQQWITAFNTCKEPNTVASLYDAGAQVWGTVSTGLLSAPEPVKQYFVNPCTSTPKSTVELGQFVVRSYGDTGISAGAYTFTIFPGGQARTAPARFTFTFRRIDGKWLIVSHHSSVLPASKAAPARPQQ